MPPARTLDASARVLWACACRRDSRQVTSTEGHPFWRALCAHLLGSSRADRDTYYVTRLLSHQRQSAVVVLCNDSNASIECGSLDAADADRVGSAGPHGSAHPNVSGHLLRSLLEINELASLAALLRKPYYGTWRHPTRSSFRSNAPAGLRARVLCPASRLPQRAPSSSAAQPPASSAIVLQQPASARLQPSGSMSSPPQHQLTSPPVVLLQAPGAPPFPSMPPQPHLQAPPPSLSQLVAAGPRRLTGFRPLGSPSSDLAIDERVPSSTPTTSTWSTAARRPVRPRHTRVPAGPGWRRHRRRPTDSASRDRQRGRQNKPPAPASEPLCTTSATFVIS